MDETTAYPKQKIQLNRQDAKFAKIWNEERIRRFQETIDGDNNRDGELLCDGMEKWTLTVLKTR